MLDTPRSNKLRGFLLGLLAHFSQTGAASTEDLETSGLGMELRCERIAYPSKAHALYRSYDRHSK